MPSLLAGLGRGMALGIRRIGVAVSQARQRDGKEDEQAQDHGRETDDAPELVVHGISSQGRCPGRRSIATDLLDTRAVRATLATRTARAIDSLLVSLASSSLPLLPGSPR